MDTMVKWMEKEGVELSFGFPNENEAPYPLYTVLGLRYPRVGTNLEQQHQVLRITLKLV